MRNLPLTFDYNTIAVHTVKSKGKISQNFVAFSEYMNFKTTSAKQAKGAKNLLPQYIYCAFVRQVALQ